MEIFFNILLLITIGVCIAALLYLIVMFVLYQSMKRAMTNNQAFIDKGRERLENALRDIVTSRTKSNTRLLAKKKGVKHAKKSL